MDTYLEYIAVSMTSNKEFKNDNEIPSSEEYTGFSFSKALKL